MSMMQDEGESWTPPDAPVDDSGASPVAEAQPQPPGQQEQPPDRGGDTMQAIADAGKMTPMEGIRQFPGNAKRILSYLTADNAAPPEVAKQFVEGVKHEYPGINDDDANVVAVHKATEMGGPAAGFALIQYNRAAYNAKAAFATAALNGIDGKAGDASAAAQAATLAGQHVLDGSSAIFTALPGGQGFTATVKQPGSSNKITRTLSPDQFAQLVNIGGEGQYDKLMEMGGYGMAIAKIAGSQGYYPAGPQTDEEAAGDIQNPPQSAAASQTDPGEPEGNAPPQVRTRVQPSPADANATNANAQTAGTASSEDPEDLPIPGKEAEPGYNPGVAQPWDTDGSLTGAKATSLDAFPGKDMQFAGNNNKMYAGDQAPIPGTHDAKGHYLGPTEPSRYAKKYEDESNGIFGEGNVNNERARQKYMADRRLGDQREQDKLDQANAGMASKRDIAVIQSGAKTGSAQITADGRRDTQNTRTEGNKYVADKQAETALAKQQKLIDTQLLRMSNSHNDAVMREEGRNAREEIRQLGIAKPGEIDKILEKHHLAREQLGIPPEPKFTPQQAPQQAPQQVPQRQATPAAQPNEKMINALKANPSKRRDFDNMFGPGASDKILGPE